jgi:hypothetical protein
MDRARHARRHRRASSVFGKTKTTRKIKSTYKNN